MLVIHIDGAEIFNDDTQEFISIDSQDLLLEHSLISISKWESKWRKSFLNSDDKTTEEVLDYIRCMTINKNIPLDVYYSMSEENLKKIRDYINSPMTATTFSTRDASSNTESIVTSELIYYWMTAYSIPFECEKWNLNRLLTLIRICSIKNQPAKKMSKSEIAKQNRAINAARRKKLNTRG